MTEYCISTAAIFLISSLQILIFNRWVNIRCPYCHKVAEHSRTSALCVLSDSKTFGIFTLTPLSTVVFTLAWWSWNRGRNQGAVCLWHQPWGLQVYFLTLRQKTCETIKVLLVALSPRTCRLAWRNVACPSNRPQTIQRQVSVNVSHDKYLRPVYQTLG